MCRRLLVFVCALVLVLSPVSVHATVGPPVKIRWLGERVPARAGQVLAGRFEIVTGTQAGVVENVRVEGQGWTSLASDAPGRAFLPAQARRPVAFRAVPEDPNEPLVIRGTFDSVPFEQSFPLDEARLARIGKSGTVRSSHPPLLSPVSKGTRPGNYSLHFTGRFTYTRNDNQVLGGDYIVVRFMDEDPISDEEIGRTVTDPNGFFDVTLDWDDCDISGCDDPDIYIIYETASDPVVVRTNDTEETYTWRTNVINDFPGGAIDFGEQSPDNGQDAVVHVYTDLIRARRYGIVHGGMTPPQVFGNFPDPAPTGAFYKPGGLNEIHVSAGEAWVEGSHIHEFGHHLEQYFNVLTSPNYQGLCAPGHCLWCPDNPTDAWQEGWANWFGSRVSRAWGADYGVAPTSIGDNRYDLETAGTCKDGQLYPSASTEGYVGMLLRDIDDSQNDDEDGGAFDCDIDAMSLGDAEIFTVFRDDDANSITDFIQKFHTRYPQYDQDFWSTIRNEVPAWSFPLPPPQATTIPPPCLLVRDGETLKLDMTGNGSLVAFRWSQNGIPLSDNFYVHGSQTKTLSIFPFRSEYAGAYDCIIVSCDGTQQSAPSAACNVMPDASPDDRPLVSWGENLGGQVGDGTTGGQRAAYPYTGIQNAVAADGGRLFSIALRKDGQLMSWGAEQWGELGDGVMNGQRNAPGPVKGRAKPQDAPQPLIDVDQIVAGKYFGLALKRDGSVWTWGNNQWGQLATGSTVDGLYAAPSQYSGCIRAIAAGEYHSAAVMGDGTVWTCGYNGSFGTLGTGSFGGFSATPVQVAGLTAVVDVEAGDYFTLALKSDGTVWGWGYNAWGTLGCGNFTSSAVPVQVTGLTNVTSIGAGARNGWAVTSGHACYGWGDNPEVGNGVSTGVSNTPQHITGLDGLGVQRIDGSNGFLFALAQLPTGRFKVWGTNHGASSTDVGIFNMVSPPTSSTVPIDLPNVLGATGFGLGNGPTGYVLGSAAVVDAGDKPVLPVTLALSALPNPSRGSATIAYDLPSPGPVSIGIYDVAGRMVRGLVHEIRPAGKHSIAWDGRSDSGALTAPGVYFLRLEAGGRTLRKALVRFE